MEIIAAIEKQIYADVNTALSVFDIDTILRVS